MNRIHLETRNRCIRSFSSIALRRRHQLPSCFTVAIQPVDNIQTTFLQVSALVPFYSNVYHTTRFLSSGFETFHSEGDDTASDNNNDDWHNLFGVEYENAWSGFRRLDNLILDKSSRYLIQRLQDLYNGIVQPYDRPTTEQCNKIINDLMYSANETQMEQYAFRADAILQCMQLFLNILPKDSSVRLPYPLPLPDRTTYVNVLTLYSKTKHLSAIKGPLRCQEIVEQMKQHSSAVGDFTLHPIAHDYNKVLLAWGTSLSPDKAFAAAKLLQTLKEENACDELSYTHVLRACAFSKFDKLDGTPERLAARIAVKVYQDMVKNNVECTPATFSYFLRACTFLDKEAQRNHLVEAAFQKCQTEGKVDATILVRLKTVASPELWNRLMGRLADNERVEIRDLPLEWTRNVEHHE